jgi:hypothetical protein
LVGAGYGRCWPGGLSLISSGDAMFRVSFCLEVILVKG